MAKQKAPSEEKILSAEEKSEDDFCELLAEILLETFIEQLEQERLLKKESKNVRF